MEMDKIGSLLFASWLGWMVDVSLLSNIASFHVKMRIRWVFEVRRLCLECWWTKFMRPLHEIYMQRHSLINVCFDIWDFWVLLRVTIITTYTFFLLLASTHLLSKKKRNFHLYRPARKNVGCAGKAISMILARSHHASNNTELVSTHKEHISKITKK